MVENLFHDDEQRGACAELLLRQDRLGVGLRDPGAREAPAQPAVLQPREVARRIIQAVGMVDAQPVDLAFVEQLEHEPVEELEDRWLFGPHGREIIEVEKAPVVDLVGGGAPVREAVDLQVEQALQKIEAGGHPGAPVERGQDAGRPTAARVLVHVRQRGRRQRKPVSAIRHGEARAIANEADEARLEDLAEEVLEHRQQNLASQLGLWWIPVYVEEIRVAGARAALEDVPPVRVFRDAHVIRDDVGDVAQPGGGEAGA